MSTEVSPLPDPALLPHDPTVLKQLVVQLLDEFQKANARLERQEHHMHLLLTQVTQHGHGIDDFGRFC